MKLTILTIIAVLIGYIGYYVYLQYKKVYCFICDFEKYNQLLKREIEFSKKTISCISLNFTKDGKGNFIELVKDYIDYLDKIKNKSVIINIINKHSPKKKFNNYLIEYFSTIGMLDYKSQIDYLKLQEINIELLKNEAKNDLKTKGNLYKKIGILLGISLMIILV